MTWAVPRTYVAGEVTTAAHLNQDARDNFKAFVAQADRVDTSQTTTSTTYTDLATAGPDVTVDTLSDAYVYVSAQLSHGTAGGITNMAYAVSGATTYAANDEDSLRQTSIAAGDLYAGTRMSKRADLTPGSNVFTAKYKSGSAGTSTFIYREILVVPVGPAVD